MGVITLKIDDALEEKFRQRVGLVRGAARGAISQSVEEAIRLWLESGFDQRSPESQKTTYVAIKNGRKIADALSLRTLSEQLKEHKVDPREVLIETIPPHRSTERMGLRLASKPSSH